MKLDVACVGKLKDRALEDLVGEYVKRSRRFFPIQLEHLRDMKALRSRAGRPRVILDERGEHLSTAAFAAWLASRRDAGLPRVQFLIGDAHGFADADRNEADLVLALSSFTLPHRLAQLLLVEQLYRAGTVVYGHPYHHAD